CARVDGYGGFAYW
nr:immunoglobulin heavy chain junction region [Mus musculus]